MNAPRIVTVVMIVCATACGDAGGDASATGSGDDGTAATSAPTTTMTTPTTGDSQTTDTGGEVPGGFYALCGEGVVDRATGVIDAVRYKQVAGDWSKDAVSCRLGPTYAMLHDGDITNDAPEVWGPTGMTCDGGYLTQSIPVQAGPCPEGGGCYGSVAGQAVYVPAAGVSPASPGLDRIQTHAWEQGAISSHPKLLASPEPYVTRPEYNSAPLGQPIAIARSERNWTNDGIAIFADGVVATAGTPTSGSLGALYRFPAHLRPSAIAVTSNNEFVLVTLWNTEALRGELAVLSVRGPTPNAHTWWYHGMFNAGGIRELKLLGTIELPFATPTAVSAVTTRGWTNPNDANGRSMPAVAFTGPDKDTQVDRCYTAAGQIPDPNKAVTIDSFADGGWLRHLVARTGYAVVASQWEDKVAFIDLAPLLAYFHGMYFGGEASCSETLTQFVWDEQQPGDAVLGQAPPDTWPYTFEVAPASARPSIAAVFDVAAPRAVRAGADKRDAIYGPNSGVDVWKAYVAGDDGVLHVFTPGRLMASWFEIGNGTESSAEPAEIATGTICAHPTALVLHRGLEGDRPAYLDVAPEKIGDQSQDLSGMGDGVVVVCRGERTLQHVVAWNGQVKAYEQIADSRMNDPVAIWYADRADVRTVADFAGQKLLSYRFGAVKIEDWQDDGCGPQGAVYGPGIDGAADLEFAGELALPGYPFAVSVANVN